jgi:hypothetical protein
LTLNKWSASIYSALFLKSFVLSEDGSTDLIFTPKSSTELSFVICYTILVVSFFTLNLAIAVSVSQRVEVGSLYFFFEPPSNLVIALSGRASFSDLSIDPLDLISSTLS